MKWMSWGFLGCACMSVASICIIVGDPTGVSWFLGGLLCAILNKLEG